MQQYLEAGKVVTTHGVRGEMKLELWCDGVAFLKKVGRLYPSLNGGKCYQTSLELYGSADNYCGDEAVVFALCADGHWRIVAAEP